MRILHIVNWYPTSSKPKTGPWVRYQIEAISADNSQEVIHLEITKGRLSVINQTEIYGNRRIGLQLPFEVWWINEILYGIILFYILQKRSDQIDVLNVHIAYPLLTYWHWIKRLIPMKLVVTEHWSAYHLNFGLPKRKNLKRIKRIFANDLKLITVSEALARDIEQFAGHDIPHAVVPNVVDTTAFRYMDDHFDAPDTFFMLSQWKYPKDPFIAIQAFEKVTKDRPGLRLVIGGYGPQVAEMKQMVDELGIEKSVSFLGSMNKEDIVPLMNRSIAFVHMSKYETFSVVCAEAICCGCPVIASKVGGIAEFIDGSNGILLGNNSHDDLANAMMGVLHYHDFDRQSISRSASNRFSIKTVGNKYNSILASFLEDH